MQCDEFCDRLQSVLDARESPEEDEALWCHSLVCSRCAERLSVWQLVSEGLHVRPSVEPAKNFARRLAADASSTRRYQRRTAIGMIAVAVAATLLLMVSPPKSRLDESMVRAGKSPQPIVTPPDRIEPAAARSEATQLDDAPLTDVDALTEEEYRQLISDVIARLSESKLDPMDQISGSIRPITATLNVALDALRRSFPSFGKEV